MDKHELDRRARKAMSQRKTHPGRETGYIYAHGRRVAAIALELAAEVDVEATVDRDILYAAALLHDVGKGIEPHHTLGAVVVRELLDGLAGPEAIDAIARIVAEHNQRDRAGACGLGSRIVQDADILDHHGPQNVWLCLQYAARHDQSVEETLAWYEGDSSRRQAGWNRSALNFEASRRRFDERLTVEREFFQMLRRNEPVAEAEP